MNGIIVRRLRSTEASEMYDFGDDTPIEGEIVEIGKDVCSNGNCSVLSLKVGARIVFGKDTGTKIKSDDGKQYLSMKEEDEFAVIEAPAEKP